MCCKEWVEVGGGRVSGGWSCPRVNSQQPAGAMRRRHANSSQCTAGWSSRGPRGSLWPTVLLFWWWHSSCCWHVPDCAPGKGNSQQVSMRERGRRKFTASNCFGLLEKFFQQRPWPKLVQMGPHCHTDLQTDPYSYTASPRWQSCRASEQKDAAFRSQSCAFTNAIYK